MGVEWRKSVMGMGGAVVDLKDDGKQRNPPSEDNSRATIAF